MKKYALSVCILLLHTGVTFADEAVAKVIKVTGEATAVDANKAVRALTRGADIFQKDVIATSATGFATIRFTDGTVIDLASASKYAINDYHYSEKEPQKDKFGSEIVEGGFRAITGSIGTRNPAAFTAKARLTTLSVRGTYFYLIAPHCEHSLKPIEVPCNDVTSFTINGTTSLVFNGKEYLTGQGLANTTFSLKDNVVTLSAKLPTNIPAQYSSSIGNFQTEVQQLPAAVAPAGAMQGGAQTSGGGGGGGSNDPCGTLNAVGNALPNTKK